MSKFYNGTTYSAPSMKVYLHAVECGFQGTVGFVQADNGGSKSIADPDVVELESW